MVIRASTIVGSQLAVLAVVWAVGTAFAQLPPLPGRSFDRPAPANLVAQVSIGDATVEVVGSEPSEAFWRSPRDATVFTAGSGVTGYVYPQRPDHESVVLCTETDMFRLRASRPLRARLTGLQPDTVYYYRVVGSSEWVRFRTAPPPGAFSPFRVTVVGDSQGPYDTGGRKDRHSLGPFAEANRGETYPFNITATAMRDHVQPDFSIHVGDVVEDARYWIQWEKEMFGDLKPYLLHAPVFAAIGNHEYQDPRWWRFFDLPNPPRDDEGQTGAYWFHQWGDSLLLCLDSNVGYYPRLDVDHLPDDIDYRFTDEALEMAAPFVEATTIQVLRASDGFGRQMRRETALRYLCRLAVSKEESRVIRTATAVPSGRDPQRDLIAERDPDPRHCDLLVFAARKADFERMWAWADAVLTRHADKRYIFVFFHHPMLYGGDGKTTYQPVMEKHRVTAVFNGHAHVFAHSVKNGVNYFQTAGLSDTVFSKIKGPQGRGGPHLRYDRHGPQYVVLDVEADAATLRGLGRDHEVFYEVRLPVRSGSPASAN